ncbi:hypothetical protein CYLTODRAFT_487553 [Cylindrobasidium torrendii FP15055 ss-10]|uniref:Uncharacterized protein n=1 Tax=Cylindrobasidium torrendii FP15055 ss-10 TaxID=1314674 RepID=A0A0D7BN90_9AGAR|nr:hypothetical protein CYLTODRAFT_487553 [Cylindrobasidium torrendii FP15055 ss-10]
MGTLRSFKPSPQEALVADFLSSYYEALSSNDAVAALTSEAMFVAAAVARIVLNEAAARMNSQYEEFLNNTDLPAIQRNGILYQFSLRRINIHDALFALGHVVRAHRAARTQGNPVRITKAEEDIVQFVRDIQAHPYTASSMDPAMSVERSIDDVADALNCLGVSPR